MTELSGKTAIVTGAAGGIGAEGARRLAADGALVIVTDVGEAGGKALAAEIGGGAVFRPLDATSDEGWAGMMAFANAEYGGLDILVNCAGFFKPHVGFEDTSLELWRQHFAVNADSVFLACKHAPTAMKPRGGGSIVNISTGLVHRMMAAAAAYCASKAAALSLTQGLRGELAPQGVHVVGALPGAVDTRMTAGLPIPKMTTAEAATEILDGFESGEEDIYVGEMARGIAQGLAHDPKAVERQLASPG